MALQAACVSQGESAAGKAQRRASSSSDFQERKVDARQKQALGMPTFA
jgi:hypothetical protein